MADDRSNSFADSNPAVPTSGPPPTRVRWIVFALACGTSWLLYLHRYTWNIVAERLVTEEGFTRTQVGFISGLFNLAYGAGQIPSGILCDLIGPHSFLAVIIAVWSVVISGYAMTATVTGLACIRIAFGLSQSGAYPALSKATQLWFPPATRTIAQGWIASGFGRGGGAMSPLILGTLFIGVFGLHWRNAILLMSALGLLFALLFWKLFRNNPANDPRVNAAERELINAGRPPVASQQSRVLSWRHAVRNRSLGLLMIQQFLSAGADSFYSAFLGTYFNDVWKLSTKSAGAVLFLPLIGGAAGGMFGAYLNDLLIRWTGSRRWSRTMAGLSGPLIASGLILLVPHQSTGLAAAIMLMTVKLFVDWSQPTVWGTCTDIGGRFSATVLGIANTAGTTGGFVLPIVFGWLLDSGSQTAASPAAYASLFTTISLIYLASSLLWLGIDCTQSVEPTTRENP